MTATPPLPERLRFGRFELQPGERRLLADGAPVAVGGRAFDLLHALADRPGQLVGKHALMDLVWPGLVVEENNLAAQVSALRKVLGGDVIATIPGRGYRFVAPLASTSAEHDAAVPAGAAVPTSAASDNAATPAPRTNLPAELPALLGRAGDCDALAALVDRHRFVSVVGAGGIGKSLLAQHLLASRRDAYPQGVCWVELTNVADADALPGAIAAALGVEVGPGEPLAALVGAVAPLAMLLALDNAEHLLDGVAQVCRALHDTAPLLRLVVTTQAPLRLAAERVLRIGPLAVPDDDALPAAQALRFGAVALFVERAQAVDQRFALTDANTAAVTATCRALDGVPLALELAAARAPSLGVDRLLASMQERFRWLTGGRNRAAPARQRALRSALEWSDALLDERERRVFRRLGVVAGSASLDCIEQVLVDDAAGLDRWAVADALDALVDRSLVAVVTTGDAARVRYRLLETPRAYALERLDAAGERAALQGRHAHAVAALLDAAYAEYFSGRVGVDEWLRRVELDFDNARDALRWARAAGASDVELRIGATLLRALPPSLHAERLALADACEARIDDRVTEPLRLQAWIELSCVLADTQKPRARSAAEAALALARRLDGEGRDRFALYHALCRAASAAAQCDDLGSARPLLDEAERLEQPSWPAQRLLWRAEAAQWIARMGGDSGEALRRGRRLLALDRERGSQAVIAIGNLVDAELAAGDSQAAARLGSELIASLSGTRHEYGLAFARINLLAALLAQDDVAAAHSAGEAAWANAAVFDLQHASSAYLALLCALEGRCEAAVRLAAYSEAIYAARGEARERNEADATERAWSLARDALDAATIERLRAEGATLRDAEVAAVAFAVGRGEGGP